MSMRSEKGRAIHKLSSEALEKGEYLEALIKTDEAMVVYQEEGDEAGFSEIMAMRLLVLNMFYDKSEFKGYLYLAKHAALASLELAENSNQIAQIALAHGAIGRVMIRLEEYKEAASHFGQTVKILLENKTDHSRNSVIADFKNHEATSRILAGEETAEPDALAAINELQASEDATPYEKDVWLSGAYMRLASGMNKFDKLKAKEYLTKADEIISANKELVVRKEQIEIMRKKLEL